MINNIIQFSKFFGLYLPTFYLIYNLRKTNLPKKDRPKQFMVPVATVLYIIVLMVFSEKSKALVERAITLLPTLLYSLGGLIGRKSLFTGIAASLLKAIRAINWKIWIMFALCPILVGMYRVFKAGLIRLFNRLFNDKNRFFRGIVSPFYEYDDEYQLWYLRENYVDTRRLFGVFYYASIVISFLAMGASILFYKNDLMPDVYNPVFLVILVSEFYFFLSGYTKSEYSQVVLGEDDRSNRVANYALLRKELKRLFGDKLVNESTTAESVFRQDITNDEIIRELLKDDNQEISSFGLFYENQVLSGEKINPNYIHSSLKLLKGESVLFNNPFYNDLIPYAFYPMNRVLLSHKKVLVIIGRNGIEEDVRKWLEDGISAITGVPYFWNIEELDKDGKYPDIGILVRSQVSEIINERILEENATFLHDVEYVVIIEPSKLISTSQIGLNMLVKKINEGRHNREIAYCMCDKNCDGLVDAMSHLLMTSITEVSATNRQTGTVSHMCWNTDADYLHHRIVPNISHYLGVGTELSFVAIKNQIPDVKWYGGDTFPVVDMKWIDRQYYKSLMDYAGAPLSQSRYDEVFNTTVDYWGAKKSKNGYMVVEDEYNNLFELLRDFSTRTESQGFINVVSPQYLLRDYMGDNAQIFETDPKAIPIIVADYIKSERNTVLKLLLFMSREQVTEESISKEFNLLGIEVFDVRKQIWYEVIRCLEGGDKTKLLPGEYRERVEAASKLYLSTNDGLVGIDTIKKASRYNYDEERDENVYSIEKTSFINGYIRNLKPASYIAEDEKGNRYYLGTELACHIYQKMLPGQFITLAGKYYEFRYLTPGNEIIVRRSADQLSHREQYWQIRHYKVENIAESEYVGDYKNLNDMTVSKLYMDFRVETPGYYKLTEGNNITDAVRILYKSTKQSIPARHYANKAVLKIKMPGSDDLDKDILYTIALLMNETFKSLFGGDSKYVAALIPSSESRDYDPLTYSLFGADLDPNSIYIIEDSTIDMGLLEAVERNLIRILEIINDYLCWHFEKLQKELDEEKEKAEEEKFEKFDGPEKPKGLFEKVKDFFRKVFHIKKKDEPEKTDIESNDETVSEEKPKGFFGRIKAFFAGLFKKKKKPEEENETDEQPQTVETEESDEAETVNEEAENESEEVRGETAEETDELSEDEADTEETQSDSETAEQTENDLEADDSKTDRESVDETAAETELTEDAEESEGVEDGE